MYQDPAQNSYPPQPYPYQPQPGAAPYPPQPYPYQPQPGAAPYPPQPYPYQPQPGVAPYPPQPSPNYPQRLSVKLVNPRANRAMVNGIISIILGLLTLITLVGYAGLITGTLAIIYGFIGLNRANKLPGNAGRGQAISGIVLGFAAWFLVIISFALRAVLKG